MRKYGNAAAIAAALLLAAFLRDTPALSYAAFVSEGIIPAGIPSFGLPELAFVMENIPFAVPRAEPAELDPFTEIPFGPEPPPSPSPAPSVKPKPFPALQDDVPVTPPEPSPAGPVEVTLTAGAANLTIDGVSIRNETKKVIDTGKAESRPLQITLAKDKPQILIMHTHATESFRPGADGAVVTVTDLGARLTEILTEHGYGVIHDTTAYCVPDYNKSYSAALKGIERTLKENPSVSIVLDIHRDAIGSADGAERKPVAEAGGKKAAQMMFVVGTDDSGLPHPNWAQNLRFAVSLQQCLTGVSPELMRPVELARSRYNQHASIGSLILEVGSDTNNGEEALYSTELFAAGFCELLKRLT